MTPEAKISFWEREGGRYEQENYGPGLAGWVLRSSHKIIERPMRGRKFAQVLEVGAGSGMHLQYVEHEYDRYVMTDGSDAMLMQMQPAVKTARFPERVEIAKQSAAQLTYPDRSFDRLIATHVLEHMPMPHEVVKEWARVVHPGGVLSIVLPCDPGLAWRFGRTLGPRARWTSAGVSYDFVMALEHINSITNLTAILRHLFSERSEIWWPLGIAFSDINLIYAVNIHIKD